MKTTKPTGTTSVTFRMENVKRERLETIAEVRKRSRNSIINEALDNYLELQKWQARHIRQGRAAADAGQTFSTEEVRSMMAEHHQRHKAGDPHGCPSEA